MRGDEGGDLPQSALARSALAGLVQRGLIERGLVQGGPIEVGVSEVWAWSQVREAYTGRKGGRGEGGSERVDSTQEHEHGEVPVLGRRIFLAFKCS